MLIDGFAAVVYPIPAFTIVSEVIVPPEPIEAVIVAPLPIVEAILITGAVL